MNVDVDGKKDGPPRQRVVAEFPTGRKRGKMALQKMLEKGPENKDPGPEKKRGTPFGTTLGKSQEEKQKKRKLDLGVARAAKEGEEEIDRPGKPGKEPGNKVIEGRGPVEEKKEGDPQKSQDGPSRKKPSPGKSVPPHSPVSQSGMGRCRGSPKPAFPRAITSSKARKKTAFRNFTGGPSPGSQSRGSVSVQQIRHMRGRSS